MSEATREIDAELGDPARYVHKPKRVIFDEHDETYFVDGKGKPCKPDKEGAKKKVRRFDKARLEEIAARCNKRDATGSLAPLTFGHTNPDEEDESKQPAPKGYARNFGVAYSKKLGRNVLVTDFYVKKEHYAEAKTYPRVSVELWDRHSIIDPVALLRRTPARDLGQWTYSKGGDVLRYSRAFSMDPADLDLPDPPEAPDAPEVEEEIDTGPSHEEKVEQFMRHCYSHPFAKEMAEHYAMPEEGMDDMGATDDQPDPTDFPAAGEEEPMMNSAAASFATAPSATNTSGASAKKPAKGKQTKPGKPAQYSAAADAKRIEDARHEQRIAALEADNKRLRYERNLEAGRRCVTQLVSEGYELDAEEEVLRFAKQSEEGRQKLADHVRKRYRRAPISSFGPVSPESTRYKSASGQQYDPENPESMPEADLAVVLRYQKEHGLYDLSLDDVAQQCLPKQYARQRPAGTNGARRREK